MSRNLTYIALLFCVPLCVLFVGPLAGATDTAEVKLKAPVLSPAKSMKELFHSQVEFENARHSFKLSWSPRPEADAYELTWGSDADFAHSRSYVVKRAAREMTVSKSMAYFARVRALDKSGAPLSPFSRIQKITYTKELLASHAKVSDREPTAVLPKLTLTSPAEKAAFVAQEDKKFAIKFSWEEAAGVEKYQFQISADPDFGSVISDALVSSNSHQLLEVLPEGRLYWRVRAKKGTRSGEWSQPSEIGILHE